MCKPETISAWENGEGKYAGEKQAAIEEQYRKLGLDGTRGQIFCIAWAFDGGTVKCASQIDGDEEADVLRRFLALTREAAFETPGRPDTIKWVGHNITGFDLRFIWQRCVVTGVKPVITIPYKAKPWDDNVFDTCIEWKGQYGSNTSGSMGAICKAFGIEGKGDMDGSKVYDEYLAGNYQKIIDYCKDDVERVRQIHKRMTFSK